MAVLYDERLEFEDPGLSYFGTKPQGFRLASLSKLCKTNEDTDWCQALGDGNVCFCVFRAGVCRLFEHQRAFSKPTTYGGAVRSGEDYRDPPGSRPTPPPRPSSLRHLRDCGLLHFLYLPLPSHAARSRAAGRAAARGRPHGDRGQAAPHRHGGALLAGATASSRWTEGLQTGAWLFTD